VDNQKIADFVHQKVDTVKIPRHAGTGEIHLFSWFLFNGGPVNERRKTPRVVLGGKEGLLSSGTALRENLL